MKVTLLGTGTSLGVPVIACDCAVCQSSDERDKRMRTAALVEVKGQVWAIDAGPDFRMQMLNSKVKRLDGIFLTHEHRDHTAGLDDVRAFNWGTKQAIQIYGEERVLKSVQRDFAYAFETFKYPGVPDFNLNEISNQTIYLDGLEITPIRVYHHKLPVIGYRIGKFGYVTDANRIPEEEMIKLQNLEVLIINGLRYESHLSHYSLPEAIEVIQQLQPKRAIITHISHQLGLHEVVNTQLPPNVELGYDGMVIEIS